MVINMIRSRDHRDQLDPNYDDNDDENISYAWMEVYLKEAQKKIEIILDQPKHSSPFITTGHSSSLWPPSQTDGFFCETPKITIEDLEHHLHGIISELDDELYKLEEYDDRTSESALSPPIQFSDNRFHGYYEEPLTIMSSGSASSSCKGSPSFLTSKMSIQTDSETTTTNEFCTPNSSPSFTRQDNHQDSISFVSLEEPFVEIDNTSNSIHKENVPNMRSTQRFGQLYCMNESHLGSSHHARLSYYENNDEIHCEQLTASQLQRIFDAYNLTMDKTSEPISTVTNTHHKLPYKTGYHLFGCDIDDIQSKNGGLILPSFIENALIYLVRYGLNSVGIFRKSGVKSRIVALRKKLEELTGSFQKPTDLGPIALNLTYSNHNEDDYCVYDIADMVKMWLRELKPKPLITREIVNLFKNHNFEESNLAAADFALKFVSLLRSDAQREILQIILQFLFWFAMNSNVNQMNAHNLAICLTPSLCELDFGSPGQENILSPQEQYKSETGYLFHAQKCLEYLIEKSESLFIVSLNSLPLNNLISTVPLISHDNDNLRETDIYKAHQLFGITINDGHLLPPKHEASAVVNASPQDILNRLLYQRNLFDPTVVEWRILEDNPDEHLDVFSYKTQSSLFLPINSFILERRWRFTDFEISSESSSLSSTLSWRRKAKKSNGIKKCVYLIESGQLYESTWKICVHGQGKSLVDHSVAFDLRGHSYDWYSKTFPFIHEWQLNQIQQSFLVDFVETKNYKSTDV